MGQKIKLDIVVALTHLISTNPIMSIRAVYFPSVHSKSWSFNDSIIYSQVCETMSILCLTRNQITHDTGSYMNCSTTNAPFLNQSLQLYRAHTPPPKYLFMCCLVPIYYTIYQSLSNFPLLDDFLKYFCYQLPWGTYCRSILALSGPIKSI